MIEETLCPKCGGPMADRKNKRTGQKFWGCKRYPKCDGTRDTDGMTRDEREADIRRERERYRR